MTCLSECVVGKICDFSKKPLLCLEENSEHLQWDDVGGDFNEFYWGNNSSFIAILSKIPTTD